MGHKQLFKFALVGGTGVVVNTAVLYFLTDIVGIFYLISSLAAIELSILNNFIWNDRWTFGNKIHTHSKVYRICLYHIVSAGSIIINIVVLYLLTNTGVYYLVSNMVGIAIAFAWNYLINKKVTWKS